MWENEKYKNEMATILRHLFNIEFVYFRSRDHHRSGKIGD